MRDWLRALVMVMHHSPTDGFGVAGVNYPMAGQPRLIGMGREAVEAMLGRPMDTTDFGYSHYVRCRYLIADFLGGVQSWGVRYDDAGRVDLFVAHYYPFAKRPAWLNDLWRTFMPPNPSTPAH